MMANKLLELLVSENIISKDQLDSTISAIENSNMSITSALVKLGHVNEKVLITFLSKYYGLEAVSLDDFSVPPELIKLIPGSLCEKHCFVPISQDEENISIAISDPTNVAAIDDIRFLTNKNIIVYLAPESQISSIINYTYTNKSSKIEINDSFGEESEKTGQIEVTKLEEQSHELESNISGSERPVINLINTIFREAIKRKSSDIHIEPYEQYSRVRFRIDGSLHEVMRLPPQLKLAAPARIKVMAQLDISEKRLPQDGRIMLRVKNKKIDVRVSTLPTIFGEKVVLRLLDQGEQNLDLRSLGFEESQYKLFKKATSQPYGMILVTGPTGSGKSTTLYSALSELNSPEVNISTVEDPVEYHMLGVNQVHVKENIGLTFSSTLRSLLRQDPDVIMVGEIRDQETAEIAIKAALTGHLVFSTLHTNDAPSTITRLVHMGIEPFLLTASILLIQAQRLVRIICPKCKEPDTSATEELLINAEVPEKWLKTIKPMKGRGCEFCSRTGYMGRKGIFEVLYLTEKIRSMIVKGANSDDLKRAAMEEGMMTLRQSALIKLFRQETTLEEVLNNSRPDKDILIDD